MRLIIKIEMGNMNTCNTRPTRVVTAPGAHTVSHGIFVGIFFLWFNAFKSLSW